MASVIKLKRSSTPGAIPAGSDLAVGEVAVNLADRVIYSKQAGGAVVKIGEAALANTNAYIASVQSTERAALANTNSSIAAQAARIDLVNTNLTATNTAIRALNTATQNALDTQEAKQASDLANTNAYIGTVDSARNSNLANTNSRLTALESGSSGTLAARVDLVNTNLTATNTAIRLLNTNTQSALDTQEAKQASDLANTNAFIGTMKTAAAAASELANTNSSIATQAGRIDVVHNNIQATNTAIRALNTATQSALDTQEAKQASNLANTNAYIATMKTSAAAASELANTNAYIASVQAAERAALANTNSQISNLSTTLSGDFLTKANPQSSGHHEHTGRMSVSTNLQVTGNTHIDGNLTVEGEVTYISTTTLEVMDPLIKLASNNQTDVVDTGFYALYDEGSTAKYAGIFRDAGDGIFKVFAGLESDPTVTVDTSAASFALAQLDANIDGGSF